MTFKPEEIYRILPFNERELFLTPAINKACEIVSNMNKDESIKDLKTGTTEIHSNNMDNKLFLEAHEWGLMNNNEWKETLISTPTFEGFKLKRVKPKPIKSKQLTKLNGEKVEGLNKFFKLTLFQLDTILNTEQIIQSQQIVRENEVLEQVMLVFNPKDECFNVKHIKDGIIVDSVKGTNKYKLIEIYNHLIDTMEHSYNE